MAQQDGSSQPQEQQPSTTESSSSSRTSHRLRIPNHITRTTDSYSISTVTDQGDSNNDDDNNSGDSNPNQQSTAGAQTVHTVITGNDYVYMGNENCAKLFSDVQLPELKICSVATAIIGYCNHGTMVADNAYIDVTLTPALALDSTTLPYVHQGGQTYRFQLGTVPSNFCGSFEIWATMSCDTAYTGQELCINSHIYPDTVCEGLLPMRPTVLVDGICLGQTTKFFIDNRGRGIAAADQVRFIVTEDHLLTGGNPTIVRQGTLTLPTNGVFTQQLTPTTAGRSNYRLEIRDVNNRVLAASVVQNCVNGSTANTINYYDPGDRLWNGSVIPAMADGCAIVGNTGIQANTGNPVYGGSPSISSSTAPLNNAHTFTQVRIAPNPMDQQAVVQIHHAKAKDYVFELYSATGQQVYTHRMSDETRFVLNRRSWPSGIYYYRLASLEGESIHQGKILLR